MQTDWRSRVQALLDVRGLTMKEASRRAGRSETWVRDILKRGMSPSAEHLEALAKVLDTSATYLLEGDGAASRDHFIIQVMGYVGAGGDIDPEFEQVPPDGMEQIELAAPLRVLGDLVGYKVRGESMFPRYNDGDIVLVDREPQRADFDALVGEEAVLLTDDGRRFLKRIKAKRQRGVYELTSMNAAAIEAGIVAASAVRVIVPGRAFRRPTDRR